MLNDSLTLKGDLTFTKYDGKGQVIETKKVDNLVVQSGKVFVADRMINTDSAVMSHMAVGTSVSAPVSTNTTLGSEIARVALVSSTRANNVVTFIADFPAGTGTGPWTEAGIFNAATDGTMMSHTTFAVINKGPMDAISIVWNITVQ